jgi:hypothetical protein
MILMILILQILVILGTPTDSYELLRISYYSNAFVHIQWTYVLSVEASSSNSFYYMLRIQSLIYL